MGLSITIASGKGGVGKTVLAANIGVVLAELGQDVIVVDTDIEMANLALQLGIEGIKVTLHDVLSDKAKIEEAIYDGPGGVRVVPGGVSLEKLSMVNLKKLDEVLDKLISMSEILIVDTAPGLGESVVTALALGQELLLVVTPELTSMPGALKTKHVAAKLKTHILGVVINKAQRDKTDMTPQEIEAILETRALAVVPEDIEVRRSSALGNPVVLRVPASPASLAIRKLAAGLIGAEYKPAKEEKGLVKRFMGR